MNCQRCGAPFYAKPSHIKMGWGKYCSAGCRSKSQFNGKGYNCHTCGKRVYRSRSRLAKTRSGYFFCNKQCQTLWRNSVYVDARHPNWMGGISKYKEILKGKKSPECFLCKLRDERILSVHHIDRDRHNNDVANLIWLCYNCHRLVHVDDGLNKRIISSLNK